MAHRDREHAPPLSDNDPDAESVDLSTEGAADEDWDQATLFDPREPPSSSKRWIASYLFILLAVGAGMLGRFLHGNDEGTPPPTPIVQVAAARLHDGQVTLQLPAVVDSTHRAILSFTVGGRLDSRLVEEGAHVSEGDLLARVDGAHYQHAVEAARAATQEVGARLGQAYRSHRRARALSREDIVEDAALEGTTANVRALRALRRGARSRRAEAQRILQETELRAPFDGVITAIELSPGEFAAPSAPVLELTATESLELVVEVPERSVPFLAPAQSVTVSFPLADVPEAEGTIRSIGHANDGAFPVYVRLPSRPDVLPGMTAQVTLSYEEPPHLVVPQSAIRVGPLSNDLRGASSNVDGEQANEVAPSHETAPGEEPDEEGSYVLLVVNGHITHAPVRAGRLVGPDVRIEGLSEGDQVVVGAQSALFEGAPVRLAGETSDSLTGQGSDSEIESGTSPNRTEENEAHASDPSSEGAP